MLIMIYLVTLLFYTYPYIYHFDLSLIFTCPLSFLFLFLSSYFYEIYYNLMHLNKCKILQSL